MEFTTLLIGLGIIIVLFIVGKIFAILTKVLFIIILVAAIAVGIFFWQNNNKEVKNNQASYISSVYLSLQFLRCVINILNNRPIAAPPNIFIVILNGAFF